VCVFEICKRKEVRRFVKGRRFVEIGGVGGSFEVALVSWCLKKKKKKEINKVVGRAGE